MKIVKYKTSSVTALEECEFKVIDKCKFNSNAVDSCKIHFN